MAAQKRDKEETELKVSENLHICTPTATPVPAPHTQTPVPAPHTQTPVPAPHTQTPVARSPDRSDPTAPDRSDPTAPDRSEVRNSSAAAPGKTDLAPPAENRASLKRPREVTRCSGSGCRKRIGLMGFRCRCGDVFCSNHRYSDRHDCSYDYKAAGREAIAKENPVVRAAKLLKV